MPGLRSLRNRLALIFALIIIGAIGTIYLSVTPRLEASLTSQRVEQTRGTATQYAASIGRSLRPPRETPFLDDGETPDEVKIKAEKTRPIRQLAERIGTEIIVMARGEDGLFAYYDTTPDGGAASADVQGVTDETVRTGRLSSRTITAPTGRFALAATPIVDEELEGSEEGPYYAVFVSSLDEVTDNVSLIRRQVLLAGGIALVIAILAGYLVARALAARVKRLERAARKVASGDFSQPIKADSDDELGRLAAAFNDMQDQLARLDRARKQFIASASHELRTPIFSLGGFLELLADEDLDEETRRAFLEQIRGQVDRMRNLAVELLDLSRLEAGALELRPEPTDVGQLAREVAAEFTPAAARHESDVELDLHREPIELECDPERVAQVLRILLDNALRHTPPGTGVRVSAERSNGHVRLEVADAGPGINGENMPHIFEPFFTSNEQAQGAGLGLAIARELAERMQGELMVRSNPGKTTFALVLPT
ncbi:HAMP domain-containing histidine kinase [Solirubrobacter sp. CPCC 204708]|uniref:histidine kinase n=1 Tax=Solirubrobacter deserti TaxID=2282478 RepID=A0ABT4RC07_9ACTN|nr:HAMP domain-containing sensor histidine kinase [Solirubrobacter deserti]MBE2317039.1 HAMP domain-containing histidine kinase [Solirubrobacter deserti]MDA0136069.1 HAMP domain-containing histidine kinase [Solirubrobacter deserti]